MAELLALFSFKSGEVWIFLYLGVEIVAVLLVIDAVITSRTSEGAVAWSVALIATPLITIPFYLLFGQRRFRGYVEARRQGDLRIQEIARELLSEMAASFSPEEQPPGGFALEHLARMPFTRGNHSQLLIDGENTFARLFEAIEQATDYILVQFYIVRHDRLGREFQRRLIQRAQSGVRVYFMFDNIGSIRLSSRYVRKMRRAGVRVVSFKTTKFNLRGRLQVNFRNHRKLMVIDGHTAFVGGMNLGDEYLGRHRRLRPWRDTQLELRGPAVQGVQLSFIEDWFWVTDEVPDLNWQPLASEDDQRVLVLPTGPADYMEACQLMFLHAINSSQKRLWIVSPYFVPDDPVVKAIKLAALRGVDVRILIPGKTDNRIVQLSSYAYVMDTVIEGVRFFQYHSGFLHQKVVLVDDYRTYIGSANLDNRSFRLNFELTVVVRDLVFAASVETMLQADFANAREIHGTELRQRNRAFQIAARIARLFSPLQ